VKIVCGKCSSEIELPKAGDEPQVRCPSCGAVFRMPSLADGEELPHPDTFPGYRVVAIVGYGGMGTVYRAIQLSMDREIAIKVLLRKYAHVPRFVTRFEREASALAVLSHPNIVGVIDRGRVDDMYYFVMEYVHGRTLRYLIRNEQLDVERCVDSAIQICRALSAAHAAGVVHRDIKPSNILVTEAGAVKVADFGIVHMIDEEGKAEQERRSRLGTAKYMAPEQRGTGEVVDARADIFGLGVTLFETLTGVLPKGQPPSELNADVPTSLDAIVAQATKADREERFQSADAMREALEQVERELKLDETSATAVLPKVAPPTLACPSCGEAVPIEESHCPKCGALVAEPCYRADCEGVNPVGAQRCGRCGGHLELLRRQRRGELEAALADADAHRASRDFQAALAQLRTVEAEGHECFRSLCERAGELARAVRRERRAVRVGLAAKGLAAGLIVAASVAIFWAAERGLFRTHHAPPPEGLSSAVPPHSAAVAVPTPPPKQPPPGPPRDALTDYFVALTSTRWAKHPPEVRLAVACDAGLALADSRNDGRAAAGLAATLDAIRRGRPPAIADARKSLAASLDALCTMLFRTLRRDRLLAKPVAKLAAQHAKARTAAASPGLRLDAAASTLYTAMATAEIGQSTTLDASARLLLLDAGFVAPRSPGDLGHAADRVVRAATLLLRYLGRHKQMRATPELTDDARRRLEQARQSTDDTVRLACGLETIVEALGATRPGAAYD